MRILVINSKGGSGKTTFALNVAVPFLSEKSSKAVNYIDVDVANKEALNVESSLINPHVIKPEELKSFRIPKNSVIDVGGNINALQTLDILDKTEKLRRIDLVAIPLAKGEQDAYNAVEIYQTLRHRYAYKGKIVFVLSQVVDTENYEREFFEFFGFSSLYKGVIKSINKNDRNIFIVPYSNEIRRVKSIFGKLPYEFYTENKNRMEELVEKLEEIEDKLDEFEENSEIPKEEIQKLKDRYEIITDIIFATKMLESFFGFIKEQYSVLE